VTQPATLPEAPQPNESQTTEEPTQAAFPHWRRDISIFLLAQSLSLFGSGVVGYAIIWYLALDTNSGWIFTVGMVAGMLPQGVISIFGGVWADRHNRKLLIMGADGVIALVTMGLAWLMLNGGAELWIIFGALALRSAGAGIQSPAVGALIPQLVPTKQLMRINSINNTVQSAIFLVAPAVAAWLITIADIVNKPANLGWIFLVDVTTAILGIGCMLLLKVPTIRTAQTAAASYTEDLKLGLRFTLGNAILRRLFGIGLVTFLLLVPPVQLATLLVIRVFGEEPWRLAAFEVTWSLGMIIGGAALAVWGGMRDRMTMILVVSLLSAALTVLFGVLPWFFAFIAVTAVYGFLMPFINAPIMTVIQERVEPEMQGRVMGLMNLLMAVGAPVGMLFAGPLADLVAIQWIMIVPGILAALLTALLAIKAPPILAAEKTGGNE
jgi:DHA3 family macrolide efflux protein-like MFS transporter